MARGKKPTGVWKQCLRCGKDHWRTQSVLARGEGRFCSAACGHAHRKSPEVVRERFWAKVDQSAGPDACWPYTGSITSHGYGCCATGDRRVMGAHKMAYILAGGTVPEGYQIMHSCDNPPCCNPKHLSVGTRLDNMADMVAKKRYQKRRTWRKLTLEQAKHINASRGVLGSGALAKLYGINQSHVFAIWGGRVWRNAR